MNNRLPTQCKFMYDLSFVLCSECDTGLSFKGPCAVLYIGPTGHYFRLLGNMFKAGINGSVFNIQAAAAINHLILLISFHNNKCFNLSCLFPYEIK